MARYLGAEPVYRLADEFRKRCLVEKRSLLWPDSTAWTLGNLDALLAAFIGHPDEGNRGFLEKWRDQLADQPDDVLRVAADVLAVYFLFPSARTFGKDAKLRSVNEVVSWRPDALEIREPERVDLEAAFEKGIGSAGTGYQTGRPWEIAFLLKFARGVLAGEADPFDPDACRQLADAVRVATGHRSQSRHVILHLLFADRFERTASDRQKAAIVAGFPDLTGGATDPDDALAAIRTALIAKTGNPDLDFYDPDIRLRWEKLPAPPPPPSPPVPTSTHTWWVNQGDSYQVGRDGGYLWSPQRNKRGHPLSHWRAMTELQPGDVVVNYANNAIRAMSRVAEGVNNAPNPDEPSGLEGFLVRVDYHELPPPIPRAELPKDWLAPGPGPFALDGNVKQGYLFPIPGRLVRRLIERFDRDWPEFALGPFADDGTDIGDLGPVQRRVVKISPGPGAKFWDVCLAEGYVCVGWDETGDLRTYPDRDAFAQVFRERYAAEYNGYGPKISEKTKEVWSLVSLRPGDLVVANRGMSEVLGVGEVVEPGYLWMSEREEYKHAVAVQWDTSFAKAVPKQATWGMKTVADVPDDLWQLISGEALPLGKTESGIGSMPAYAPPPFPSIFAAIKEAGLRIDERTLRRYHLSLVTRGFVVLAGGSGTGKTWLAQAYAAAVGARCLVVAVAPNWTTNEDLLGYANPLTGAYHDTGFSRFLRAAAAEWERAEAAAVLARPYHLVLDEMNLARVEYYFAQFLSAMELRARDGAAALELGGEHVRLGSNLAVVGTVNVDETTHGFADKVYDRAQLVELHVRRNDLQTYVAGAPYAEVILQVWDAVQQSGPFAFRVLDEIGAYVEGADGLGVPWEDALDEQLLQKVLPKLKGADPRVGVALDRLVILCAERFPLTRERASEMLEGYRAHGFASYFR